MFKNRVNKTKKMCHCLTSSECTVFVSKSSCLCACEMEKGFLIFFSTGTMYIINITVNMPVFPKNNAFLSNFLTLSQSCLLVLALKIMWKKFSTTVLAKSLIFNSCPFIWPDVRLAIKNKNKTQHVQS